MIYKFLSIDELESMPPPRWMIDGLFEQDALVMLAGPPGAFKSFLAIDWALCLAAGRPWNGRAIEPSRVLYALGEGKASLLKRIQAWINHADLSDHELTRLKRNFKTTFEVPQLASPKQVEEFIEAIHESDYSPTLLVIDTLSRSLVGKNENDQIDAGVWVNSADNLRKFGMTVLVLHHSRKNTEFGLRERGSSVFMGAMDTAFMLERNPEGFKGYAKLVCTKQKDHEEPPDLWLTHMHIRPDPDAEGSIVLIPTAEPGTEELEIKHAEEQALDFLIANVINDTTFKSDRARARFLAEQKNMLESTAMSKIHRAKKKIIPVVEEYIAEQELSEGA